MNLTPIQGLLTSTFITAIYPIVGKYGVGYISPSYILLLGTFITVLYFAPWLTKNKMWGRFFARDVYKKLIVVGLFGSALPFLIMLLALNYTTPANAAILNQFEVVYSIILAMIFLRERPTLKQLAGTALVVLGCTLVMFSGDFAIRWKGDLMVVGAVWMFQVSHIAAKKLPADLQPQFISAARSLYAFFWTIPLSIAISFFMPLQLTINPATLGVLFYVGVINYGFGNACWYVAIRNMDLSKATAVILSYPVITYITSVILGLDKINALQIAGLTLALLGAYTVTNVIRSSKK